MREKDYLARLTRTARWRLPTKEADDIIEDYTELLMIDFRPYEDLCRDYGTPKYAVRQLSFFRDYGRWLLTFWVLAAFLALPALGLFVPMPTISFLYGWQEALLLCLSLVLSIAWFPLERWLALFTAGLTVVFLTAILYRIVTNMSIPDPPAVWFTTEVWQIGITAALGVIGTGVALC